MRMHIDFTIENRYQIDFGSPGYQYCLCIRDMMVRRVRRQYLWNKLCKYEAEYEAV